jgi:predicted ATP-binding protein involved in virulence
MQLYPNDIEWDREKELLEKIKLIGLGSANESQVNQFIFELKIDDIVLIKRGNIPIALVKVVGDLEDVNKNDLNNLDWFRYRRKVKVIDWAKGSKQSDFPNPSGTIKKATDENSKSYKYIDRWYRKTSAGIKLRHIYIENYKMFKEFNISLIDDNKPLPIIVIAGINGSGKTSLLEYIKDFVKSLNEKDRSYIKFEDLKEDTIETLNSAYSKLGEKPISEKLQKSVIYVPLLQNTDDVKRSFFEYQQDIMFKKDIKPSESYKTVIDNIHHFLGELDLYADFDGLDKKERIYFKNKGGTRFSLDELSSGQKTILTKMLNLFFCDVRGKVILIDEPELSLHPEWQNRILKIYEYFAKENNCQIIIATHSPHIIGSAKNEYIRVLKFNEENNVEVIDRFSQCYGLEFSKIMTDIMGVKELRTPDVEKDLKLIKEMIYSNQFKNNSKFKKRWDKLESILGKFDLDLKLLKLEIDIREKNNVEYKQK